MLEKDLVICPINTIPIIIQPIVINTEIIPLSFFGALDIKAIFIIITLENKKKNNNNTHKISELNITKNYCNVTKKTFLLILY